MQEDDSFKSFGHVCELANGLVNLLIDGCHFAYFLLEWERTFVNAVLKDKEMQFKEVRDVFQDGVTNVIWSTCFVSIQT